MKFASFTGVVLTAGVMAIVLNDRAYTDTRIDICSKHKKECNLVRMKNRNMYYCDNMGRFYLNVTEADNFTSVVFSSTIYLENGTYGRNHSTSFHSISSNTSAFESSLPEGLNSLDSDMIRQEQMLSRFSACLSNKDDSGGYYSADRLINITRELRKMMNTVKCNLANNNAFNVTGNVTTTNYFCATKVKDNSTGELKFRSEFKMWTHLVRNSPSESAEHIDSDIQELLKQMSHIRQCQITDTSYGPYSWFTGTVSNCCDGWRPETDKSDSGFTMIAISVAVVVASIAAVMMGVLKYAKSRSNQRSSGRLCEGLVHLQEGNGGLHQGDLPSDGIETPSEETKSKTQKLMRVMRLVFEDGTTSETSGGKTHDMFLHYHDNDIEWVEEFLIPFLVETLEMTITHKEDFLPGSIKMEEQIKCLSSCEFIVLVLSNSFVKDPVCRDVTIRAYSTSPHRIVPLGFKLTCELDSDPVFMGLVRTNGLIKWPDDDQKRANFWSQLRKHFISLNERSNNLEEKVQLIKNCLTPKNSNEVSAKAKTIADDRTIEAFVYFHDDDSNWTKSSLIPYLENKLKMIVKTVDDIQPGSITLVETLKSLNQTDLFVFVISDSFIGEQECREFLARTYSLRRHEILQVVLDLSQTCLTDHYGVVLNLVKPTNQLHYFKTKEPDFLESVKVRSKAICIARGRNGFHETNFR